jgi:predicted amidohydrolase
MSNVKLATVSMNVVYDKKKNLEKLFGFIDQAAAQDVNLIIFPETSLQGYLHNMIGIESMEDFRYQHINAETVPEGESVRAVVAKAKAKNIYVIFGMVERDEEKYDKIYNTAVLLGPEGYIGKYRKVHQIIDELHVYYPGEEWPVYNTAIGRIGMLICYDKTFPESARELALKGAEILAMPTAFALQAPGADYRTDYMKYVYDLYDKTRALENQCFFLSSNHFGQEGKHEYFGFSRIVAPTGMVIDEVGFKEGMAIAEVDIKKQIVEARLFPTQLKDRKPSTYTKLTSRY